METNTRHQAESNWFKWRQNICLYSAFLLVAYGFSAHIVGILDSQLLPVSHTQISLYILPSIAIIAMVLVFRNHITPALGALILSAVFALSVWSIDLHMVPRIIQLAALTTALLLTLTYLRIGLPAYVALALGGGVLVGATMDDWGYGVAAAACFGGLLFVANYTVQLVLDHRQERSRLVLLIDRLPKWKIAGLTILFWLPSATLVVAGMAINWQIQTKISDALYASNLIERSTVAAGSSARSELERDVYHTIDVRELEAQQRFAADLAAAQEKGDFELAKFPGLVSAGFEKARPPGIDEHKACQGAELTAKILGKRRRLGSFKGLCRNMLRAVENMVMTTYDRSRTAGENYAGRKTEQWRTSGQKAESDFAQVGKDAIKVNFDRYRALAAAVFIMLLALSLLSYLTLTGALVGGFNIVLGRLLFDAGPPTRENRKTTALAFRLDPLDGDATRLDYKPYNALKLRELSNDRNDIKLWYVSFDAMRVGAGTHMRLSSPQPHRSILQRLVSRRYLMTKVAIRDDEVVNASTDNEPTISSPGDLKLICIKLERGQEVVFHMSEMIAFTNGVRLTSIYTAHLATHLLGLGSFYSVASGTGYLVLLSEGADIRKVKRGLSFPPATLLAWDRRTEFTLAQQRSLAGVWFNDPSVISSSDDGVGILDEGRAGGTGLWQRLWRLFRYLFMPF